MDKNQFIELTFMNGIHRIVNKRYIISLEQVCGETHVVISGVNHFEVVTFPYYHDLVNLLLESDNK